MDLPHSAHVALEKGRKASAITILRRTRQLDRDTARHQVDHYLELHPVLQEVRAQQRQRWAGVAALIALLCVGVIVVAVS